MSSTGVGSNAPLRYARIRPAFSMTYSVWSSRRETTPIGCSARANSTAAISTLARGATVPLVRAVPSLPRGALRSDAEGNADAPAKQIASSPAPILYVRRRVRGRRRVLRLRVLGLAGVGRRLDGERRRLAGGKNTVPKPTARTGDVTSVASDDREYPSRKVATWAAASNKPINAATPRGGTVRALGAAPVPAREHRRHDRERGEGCVPGAMLTQRQKRSGGCRETERSRPQSTAVGS